MQFYKAKKMSAGKSKSQFAIEFIVLIAFMFFMFIGFIAVIASNILNAKDKERLEIAEDISSMVKNEIDLAMSAANGYKRSFELPIKVDGNAYDISIIGNRELVVSYVDKEHISFLPQLCGDILIPSNEISKEESIVCINAKLDDANLDKTKCAAAAAAKPSLCDQTSGTRCCCQLRYKTCSP